MAFDPQKTVASRLVLLAGDDAEGRRKAVPALLQAAGLQPDDMDLETIIADQKPFSEWAGSASIIPFLADRRAVVVRNVVRADPNKSHPEVKIDKDHPIVRAFAELPPSGLLILVADTEQKDENDARASQSAVTRWEKVVKAAGGVTEKFVLQTKGLDIAVRDRAKELGKTMSRKAALTLVEMTSNRVDLAFAELEKLALYVGDAPDIREDDVKACVTPDYEYKVFALLDLVTTGNTPAALTQLRTLFGKTAKIENEAFPRLIPVFLKQFRILWQARACVESGTYPVPQNPHADLFFPATPNLTKEQDWLKGRHMEAAKRLSFPQLKKCLDVLLDLDAKLKGARPAYDGLESVEQAVLVMAETCKRRK